jgi:hypothetical protein
MNPGIPKRDRIAGYMSVSGASKVSGLSGRQIQYLVNTRRLKAISFGGVFAVDLRSLDEYMASSSYSGNRQKESEAQ